MENNLKNNLLMFYFFFQVYWNNNNKSYKLNGWMKMNWKKN